MGKCEYQSSMDYFPSLWLKKKNYFYNNLHRKRKYEYKKLTFK